jgi:hypothetical protein
MRSARLMAAALSLALAGPVCAADWVDIKDPKALRALYSNKTFKGKDFLDRPFVGHYRADGKGLLFADGARMPRTWSVEGNDKVCIDSYLPRACFRAQRHASRPNVYRLINLQNDIATEITVEDGVPNF